MVAVDRRESAHDSRLFRCGAEGFRTLARGTRVGPTQSGIRLRRMIMNASKRRLDSAERGLAKIALLLFVAAITLVFVSTRTRGAGAEGQGRGKTTEGERQTDSNAQRMLDEGKQTFRFDTFGDEAFWSDALQLHRAIAGANNGGVGPGVSPAMALAVGLKVDTD